MTSDEQMKYLAQAPGGIHFQEKVRRPLKARNIETLQINVGKKCNLSCRHCHVEAGPERTELMSQATLEACLGIIKDNPIGTVDITGGSPEMNPGLPWFLGAVSELNRRIMVRSNLVILTEANYARFIEIYAKHGIEVVSSLPAYDVDKFERQRGEKTFDRVIEAIRKLNQTGYGRPGSGLILNLVHNPVGAYLPGSQSALERDYRIRLSVDYGIYFNSLYCLTNCPVGRYLEFLVRTNNYNDYMRALISAFNLSAVDRVMCRTTLSVGWDGTLYDCDFNQMLNLPVNHGAPDHIDDFDLKRLNNRQVMVGNHCFSCTAGAGSSCQGALDQLPISK
jgi:radical SAM/Cys-rich protein